MCEYLWNEASYGNETWKQQRSPYLASHETIKRNLSLVQTMRVFARTDTFCGVMVLYYMYSDKTFLQTSF